MIREDQHAHPALELSDNADPNAPDDVLLETRPPERPGPIEFAEGPSGLDSLQPARGKRRVAGLEHLVRTHVAETAQARAIALDQHRLADEATAGWQAAAKELEHARSELDRLDREHDELVRRTRAQAERVARDEAATELGELQGEIAAHEGETRGLERALEDQRQLGEEHTERWRAAEQSRAIAESEARRAKSAYEIAERERGEASAALQRCAADDQERIHALHTELVSATGERDRLAEEITGLTGEHGQVGTLSARVEDLLIELAELDDEIRDQRIRAETAEETVAALESDVEAARAERSERTKLRDQLDAEASRVAELNARVAELDVQASQVTELNARVAELDAEASQVAELNARVAELDARRRHSQTDADTAASLATDAEARLEKAEAQRADLERAVHAATDDQDRLARRLAEVEAERDELRRAPKDQAVDEFAEIARRPREADVRRSALDGLKSLTDP